MKQTEKVRIGDILKEYGYANDADIARALEYQQAHPEARLGDALVALGSITEAQLLRALERRFSMRVVKIGELHIDINAVRLVPRRVAEKNSILPVGVLDDVIFVVTDDPTNFMGLEEVRQLTGKRLEVSLCEKASLNAAIAYYYSEVSAKIAAESTAAIAADEISAAGEIEGGDDETPVIKLIDSLISRAYSIGASDIHIEPFESQTDIRMRTDGVIREFLTVKKSVHPSLIARVKILSGLDIAEKRIPQDGHFRFKLDDIPINIRVSVIPTVFGEKAVLRLLASNVEIDNNTTFGMKPSDFEIFSAMLRSPNGMIYLTGPTGSGKSTTLYMVLELLARRNVNIVTIEDPVEKNVPGVNQMQVNNLAGLTFGSGLRAMLRQDPDIIMVGETRDSETASIAVRAAITGHLVFSTLHTNDAASSVVRLADMGVERYLIANSLVGVVAQRLVRKLCPKCAVRIAADELTRSYMGDIESVMAPVGCDACHGTGYNGRTAIHEILPCDTTVREMINRGASTPEVRDYAVGERGMTLLRDSAADLVRQGITSVEELIKVAYYC